MSTVFMHAVVSVDGFIADAEDNVGPLFEWYFNGDAEIVDGGPFKVSRDSVRYVRPLWQRIGTTVMGRHLFDLTNGWEGTPPAGEHIVVVTHRPRPEGWHPEASCQFIDDVVRAIMVAKELAGDRDVAVTAGNVGGQALARRARGTGPRRRPSTRGQSARGERECHADLRRGKTHGRW